MLNVAGLLMLDIFVIKFLLMKFIRGAQHAYVLLKYGEYCEGKIIDLVETADMDGHPKYDKMIEYTAFDGIHVFRSEDSKYFRPAIGAKVKVSYLKNDPEVAVVNPDSNFTGKVMIVLFIVAALVVVNWAALRYWLL